MSTQTPSYAAVAGMGATTRPGTTPGDRPDLAAPEPYEVPTRERPEYDEGEVSRLTQEHSAAGTRTLREAYQTAASRLPSNPQTRLTLRDALKGYGTGLENVMSGARKTARAQYGQKFAAEERAVGQEYAAQVAAAQQQATMENQRLMLQFQQDYDDYMREEEDQPQTGGFYSSPGTWVPPGTPGPLGVRPGM